MITPEQLHKVCPTVSPTRCTVLAGLINDLGPKYGLDTQDELHEFIAQVAHESNEFMAKSEGLSYSAGRLTQVWPSRFPTFADALPYARNPEKLANKVYANRMGNGPEISGDGYKFRGGGFIQLTGRDMFTKFARYKAVDVGTVAGLVRSMDLWAMDSALWLFCIEKSLLDEAERDELVKITKAINGGTIGLVDRQKYYERAKRYIV